MTEISAKQVSVLTGLSTDWIHRISREGKYGFPQPVSQTTPRTTRWSLEEVNQWLQQRNSKQDK